MATTNKGLNQPALNATNWNTPLNDNFGYIDAALGGTTSINVTGVGTTAVTLTLTQYQSLILNFTGTLTANVTYQVPSGVGGQWIVANNATGAFTLTIRTAAAAGSVNVATGTRAVVYSDGTNVNGVASSGAGTVSSVNVSGGTTGLTASGGPITTSGTITLAGTLAVANGGTGGTTQATAQAGLGLGSMATQASSSVSITGGSVAATTLTGNIASARLATALNASGSAPYYVCRAWVNFNGSGTVSITASGNVTSITDNGVGDYTVNFTTAMPDANYAVSGTLGTGSTAADGSAWSVKMNQLATTLAASCRIRTTYNSGGTATYFDPNPVLVMFVR